jgi:hypothetical protein
MGYGCRVDQSLRDALGALASAWNTTLPIVLFTAFLRLVRRFHASNVVGAYLIHAGRDHVEFMNTVGVFVNPLLVISWIDDLSTFEQAVRQIHGEIHALLSHQTHPVEYVSDRLGLPSYTAPFAFNMLNIPNVPQQKELADFGDYRKFDLPPAKFSMELYVLEYSNGLELFFSFNGKHYDMPMIEYVGGEDVRLIGRVAAGTSSPPRSDGRKTLNLPGEASRPSNCDDRN